MAYYCNKSIITILFILAVVNMLNKPTGAESVETKSFHSKHFIVFDATLYKNKPDLAAFGIKPLRIIYAGEIWQKSRNLNRLPARWWIEKLGKKVRRSEKIVALDVEQWPLKGDKGKVESSVEKYLKLLEMFKTVIPWVKIGYYGIPPVRDYWRAIQLPQTFMYHMWQLENSRLLALAKNVDVFFPSLYAFYSDQENWIKYAVAQISETRRYGENKPIYVFLWPEYHDSNRLLKGQYIPKEFWRCMLETAYLYSDGIVIWGGWKQNWNNKAPWWAETREFCKQINLN